MSSRAYVSPFCVRSQLPRARADSPRSCARSGAAGAVGIEAPASVTAMTRQSSHILSTSRRCGAPWNIQCLPSSLAVTRSIVLLTPNGLPQRMQANGSSCLSTRAAAVAARKSSCGTSVITFSGQVALHSPHCTQASSEKRSIGRSGSSPSAPVGQADTQARQSVQPATSISTAPNGAPAGSATTSTGAGAARCSSRSASRSTSRLPPDRPRSSPAAAPAPPARSRAASRRAHRDRRSRSWRRDRRRNRGRRGSARQARASCRRPVTSWRGFARSSKRSARRAIGERRRDRFEADLRHLVDRERQHVRRQAVAEARQRVDQRRAVRVVVDEHDRMRRRRLRDRP